MSTTRILKPEDWLEHSQAHPAQSSYLAMYSSWIDGIVTDPRLMLVPVDDHLVHRGDGVFEALKVVGGKAYLLEAHLDRLQKSLSMIRLQPGFDRAFVRERVVDVARAAGRPDLLIRLYVSRGPGGFGVDPKESIGAQLYVVATALKAPASELYDTGVAACTVTGLMKESPWSQVKSCNYLPNVMMKMAANQQGAFLALNATMDGDVGEGSTENLLVMKADGSVVFPPFDYTLRGTTLLRLAHLLGSRPSGPRVEERAVAVAELLAAQEAMAVGTTLDVLPIVSIDGRPIGTGRVGPFAREALAVLRQDVRQGGAVLTPIEAHVRAK